MIFYHFTSTEFLDAIRAEGLTRGEVPLSAHEVINGVWLTTDPNPEGHGLSDGEALPESAVRKLQSRGLLPQNIPTPLYLSDKRSARITIKLPFSDRALRHWPRWGRKRLAPEWHNTLTEVGGGQEKANTWYVCFRTIEPAEFVAVDILRDPAKGHNSPSLR